jgi:SAM-dependent methyltransferase
MKDLSVMGTEQEKITFSFGANWMDYVNTVSEASIQAARDDIERWLGAVRVRDKTILDIGCGSGLHSLVFHRMGARRILSMDVDPRSVQAARALWQKEGRPEQWIIEGGSILDGTFLSTVGVFDMVYAWGVLHHTGAMWEALENASRLVAERGCLWIALYADGPNYDRDLCIKRKYNSASRLGKRIMVYRWIGKLMRERLRMRQNPLRWNHKKDRGMNVYHDIVDWLGGLPYEVANPEKVMQFFRDRGFLPEKVELFPEGSNHIYLFKRLRNGEGGM